MSTGCFPSVLSLCVFMWPGLGIKPAEWLSDFPAGLLAAGAQRRRRRRRRRRLWGFPWGSGGWMSGGNHQGLNLFSQFCFPQRFLAEFLLYRGEGPDCEGHKATGIVVLVIWCSQLKEQQQHVCSFCTFAFMTNATTPWLLPMMQHDSNSTCLTGIKGECQPTHCVSTVTSSKVRCSTDSWNDGDYKGLHHVNIYI